jgi:hypothetical protein
MKKNTLPPPNELLRRETVGETSYLDEIAAMLKLSDPLGKNPKVCLQHVFTLVRPADLMAAEFIWRGLCKHYRISNEHGEKLRYVARVMSDYATIEAHTQMHEPLFEREKH